MSVELVPIVDAQEIAQLPIEARGQLITQALVESKSWLAVATKGTDPTPIAEFKAWAATVAEMTKQKGLAEDIQLDALEMVRRAERGIGVAIRNGQEAGTFRTQTDNLRKDSAFSPREKACPSDFFPGGGTQAETYAMTDGVSDSQFEEALDAAREEKNLGRRNVVRKIRSILPLTQRLDEIAELAKNGASSRQIAKQLGGTERTGTRIRRLAKDNGIDIPADRVVGKTARIDPERVIRETLWTLEGVRQGLDLIRPEDFDGFSSEQVGEWLSSLKESLRCLRRFEKELNQHV